MNEFESVVVDCMLGTLTFITPKTPGECSLVKIFDV